MPTVLGEMFDQMILVEGFYMSGLVIGILTTLQDWMFCWFPADTKHFSSELESYTTSSAFLTLQKTSVPTGESTCPPRDTSSRRNHGIELLEDDQEDPYEFVLTAEVVERALHTSPPLRPLRPPPPVPVFCFHAHDSGEAQSTHGRPSIALGEDDALQNISFHSLDGIPFAVECC